MAKAVSQVLSQIIRSRGQQTEESHVSLDKPVASPDNFACWLRSHADIDVRELSRQRLVILYGEFCDYYDLAPWPTGRFDRSLKAAGFQRYRLSTPGRPWIYRLRHPNDACDLKTPRPPSAAGLDRRRGK